MVEGLIGKKIGMSQTFDAEGNVVPVTVIKAGPCTVIQKKTKEKDGYAAVQLGLVEDEGVKQPIKPQLGHFKKAGVPPVRILREFRFEEEAGIKEGDQVLVDIFQEGEKVHVVGTSKGKGFASVIKRWGFRGGKASHGSMFHRAPGSIGASAFPSRVVKGKKLPGHMGHSRVTIMNITIVQADKENNLLVVKGAVPGANGGYLLVKKADFNIRGGREKKAALEAKKQIPEEKMKAPEEKKVPEAKQQAPTEKKIEKGKLEEKKPDVKEQASEETKLEEMKPEPEESKPEPMEKKPALEAKKLIPEEEMKAPEEKKVPEAKEQAPTEKKLEKGKPEEKKLDVKEQTSEEKKLEEMKSEPEESKPEPKDKKAKVEEEKKE